MEITVIVVATAALFAWGLFSNRLERADLTAPIVFIAVGVGPGRVRAGPGHVRSRGRHPPRRGHAGVGAVLRRRATARPAAAPRRGPVPPTAGRRPAADHPARMGPGGLALPGPRHLAGTVRRRGAGPHRRRPRDTGRDQPGRAVADPSAHHRRERPQRRHRHPRGDAGHRRRGRGRRPGARPGRRPRRRRAAHRRRGRRRRRRCRAARRCAGPDATGPLPRAFAGIAVLALALAGVRMPRSPCTATASSRPSAEGWRSEPAPVAAHRPSWSSSSRRAPCSRRWCGSPSEPSPSPSWSTASTLSTVLYAVLSLTVVRMLPVALASIGAGLDRTTVLFVGWFGPRGLASLVFALLALEALGTDADEAVAVLTTTVLLSVVAHGLTAAPLARRYGESAASGRARTRRPGHRHPDPDDAMTERQPVSTAERRSSPAMTEAAYRPLPTLRTSSRRRFQEGRGRCSRRRSYRLVARIHLGCVRIDLLHPALDPRGW